MPQYVVHLSVRPSVMFRYRDRLTWNASKIITRLSSLRYMLRLTPTRAISQNYGGIGVGSKSSNISETVQDREQNKFKPYGKQPKTIQTIQIYTSGIAIISMRQGYLSGSAAIRDNVVRSATYQQ